MFVNVAVLQWGWQDGLVVVMLLLLAQDLKLQELLLLLQQVGIGRVHGHLVGLLLLVGGDILMVLQLLHPWLGLFALFAAAFITGCPDLAVLWSATSANGR